MNSPKPLTWLRAAAIELSIGQDEDLGVRLLEDIRDLFDLRPGIDRLTSAAMVDGLLELPDGLWSEWRGPQDNQVPHRMSQGGLATMLAPFGIRSRTIWPRDGSGGKSARATPQPVERLGRHTATNASGRQKTAKSNTYAELEASGLPSGLTGG